jgi:hypothetical protein
MAHSDQSSFSPIENLNQSSSGRSSHQRTRRSRTQERQEAPYRSHMHSLAECAFLETVHHVYHFMRTICMFKSHMRSVPHGNRDVLVEYRGINTCVDTDWKIVSGVIADAEREEDAGYIEHILFMSKEWLRPIGLRGLMPHLAISGQCTHRTTIVQPIQKRRAVAIEDLDRQQYEKNHVGTTQTTKQWAGRPPPSPLFCLS